MAARALRTEEGVGLILAILVHAGLVGLIVLRPATRIPPPPVERVTVTLSDDIGLTSTSPEPMAQAAADSGPELGQPAPEPEPAPPEPEPVKPQPVPPKPVPPKPVPQPPKPVPPKPQPPKPAPTAAARPQPRPTPRPVPAPAARPAPRPAPSPAAKPAAAPRPTAAAPRPTPRPAAAARPATSPARPATGTRTTATAAPRASTPAARPGASSFADAFKKGVPGARPSGAATAAPAATIGPAERSAIGQAIGRQLKPHWLVPQGAETDQLVTRVRFRLARNGTLVGEPEVVETTGVTAANRAQVDRHREQAIRAIKMAAPFTLPAQYYSAWQVVTSTFDRRLSQ